MIFIGDLDIQNAGSYWFRVRLSTALSHHNPAKHPDDARECQQPGTKTAPCLRLHRRAAVFLMHPHLPIYLNLKQKKEKEKSCKSKREKMLRLRFDVRVVELRPSWPAQLALFSCRPLRLLRPSASCCDLAASLVQSRLAAPAAGMILTIKR